MMNGSQWILIPPQELNKPELSMDGGVEFQTMPSPFDVPHSFRISEENKRLIIDFKYISDRDSETVKVLKKPDGFSLHIGKYSKRLFTLEIDLEVFERQYLSSLHDADKENVYFQSVLAKSKDSGDISKNNSKVLKKLAEIGFNNERMISYCF